MVSASEYFSYKNDTARGECWDGEERGRKESRSFSRSLGGVGVFQVEDEKRIPGRSKACVKSVMGRCFVWRTVDGWLFLE